jgi:hypothetical protein
MKTLIYNLVQLLLIENMKQNTIVHILSSRSIIPGSGKESFHIRIVKTADKKIC